MPPGLITHWRCVQPGEAAKFTAKAVSQETIDYQWQLDEKDIPGATQETLLVNNVQPGSCGDYSVKVSNHTGVSMSRKAKLTVVGPLRLELLPVHDDSLHIQAPARTGLTYTLQSSDDLNHWTDLATRTSSGAAIEFVTPISPTNGSRLYRIRQGP